MDLDLSVDIIKFLIMALNSRKLYFFNIIINLLPVSSCNTLKVKLLRWCGAIVGNNVSIFSPRILGNCNLIIGDNVWLGYQALIFGPKDSTIKIDNFAKVGSRAIIVTGYHKYSIEYENIAGPGEYADVHICQGACVGTNSIILPGKIVGEKAHVTAGAIVTHDVPPHTRVAGVPARVIKTFTE